jgi:hypothetical protein
MTSMKKNTQCHVLCRLKVKRVQRLYRQQLKRKGRGGSNSLKNRKKRLLSCLRKNKQLPKLQLKWQWRKNGVKQR